MSVTDNLNPGTCVDAVRPAVSIGLAVRNGEDYLREAVDSILAQTFENFELIISDNASTDATEKICREYAAADSRVRYYRNPTNIGGAKNENLTVQLATAPYFRWAAHDDVLAPTLLERLVEALEQRRDATLAYTASIDIDGSGAEIGRTQLSLGVDDRLDERFARLAARTHACEPTYGLVRREDLLAVGLQGNYADSDRVMLCRLALRGPFVEITDNLFFKRYHDKNRYTSTRARMAWFNPSNKGKVALPNWMTFFGHWRTVLTARLSASDRMRCAAAVMRWGARYWRELARDIVVAVASIFIPRERRFASDHFNWE